jgi:two-component system OmpR family response regulator
MKKKILIVDDEQRIVDLVKAYLEKEGYATIEALDGELALKLWREEKPDLVVLDILMPQVDGLEFCREVRKGSDTPIIILSARSQEEDRLTGLELGADDYVVKPFSPRELVARVRAVLRRQNQEEGRKEPSIIEGPLVINREKRLVEVDGEEIQLTATEFDILETLASYPGRVYSRGQLVGSEKAGYHESNDRTVDAHIKNIRKKLGEKAVGWSFIETVYGIGYRFQAKKQV